MAVVGVPDELKGQLPCALYVLRNPQGADLTQIKSDLVQMVRKDVGAVAAFKMAISVGDLPRTRSGKTPRKSLSELTSGREFKVNTVPTKIKHPSYNIPT